MPLTLESIHQAHQRYTGPDFPKLIRVFKEMGIVRNHFDLETGQVTYLDRSGASLEDEGIRVDFTIPEEAVLNRVRVALKRNQRGESDFPTFCNEMAQAGIVRWISDLEAMTCTYYDKPGRAVVTESIPEA